MAATDAASTWSTLSPQGKADAIRAAIAEGAASATEIQAVVQAPSRNAVIGVCVRRGIGLPGPKPGEPGRSARPAARHPWKRQHTPGRAPAASRAAASDAAQEPSRRPTATRSPSPGPRRGIGVRFLDRARLECAWILDDFTPIDDRRCCGNPVPDDGRPPYCTGHRAIAFGGRAGAAPAEDA
jgi:hypothetical protein